MSRREIFLQVMTEALLIGVTGTLLGMLCGYLLGEGLVALVARAAASNVVDGEPEGVYEPLDHIEPGLPRTLIHVSGSEVLLHDARLAARRLAAAGVPIELRVWPGQIHDFQMAAPLVPEATRSLRQIGRYIREATG